MLESENKKPLRIFKCPGCAKSIVYSRKSPFRPFCSQACKDNDIIAWAEQSYRIQGRPPQNEEEFLELEKEITRNE